MIVALPCVKRITQQYKEPIWLILIFVAYLFYFRGTFIGANDLLTGDIEHWYGVSAHFLNGFYNGVLPLWNPYSQGGEPFFPYFGLFRLLDPIHLILVGIGRFFDPPIFHLHHFQYVVRCFVCLLGFYYVYKELNKSFVVNLICFLFILLYFSASVVDAMYATFCWIPFILFFFLRFVYRQRDHNIYYCIFFLGIYIGSGSYHIATGLFFLSVVVLSLFLTDYRTLLGRFRIVFFRFPIASIFSLFLMLIMISPIVFTYMIMETDTIPIARTFYDRELFVGQTTNTMDYQSIMQEGQSLAMSDIWLLVWTSSTLRFFGFSVPLNGLVIPIAIIGVLFGKHRLRLSFLLVFLSLFFYLLGKNSPVHYLYTIVFPPLAFVRITRFADIFFIFLLFYFFSLGLHRITSYRWRTIRVGGKVLVRSFLTALLVALTVGEVSYFETHQKYHPDFDYRAGPIIFNGKRIFALARTHYYLMDPALYRTVTALQMLAAPPDHIKPNEHPYYVAWNKLNRHNRAGAVYGLRSILWTKGYHTSYLLGENDLEIFNTLLGVNEDIVVFRPKAIVASDSQVRSLIKDSEVNQFRDLLANYTLVAPEHEHGLAKDTLIPFKGAHYAGYVRDNPDLIQAYKRLTNRDQSIGEWGKWHWETHGQNEDRSVTPQSSLLTDLLTSSRNDNSVSSLGLPLTNSETFSYQVKSYNYNGLLLEIYAPKDGFVVYRDGYTNDWKTSIDGRDSTTRRVDINSKGVFVSKGKHLLEFSYTPRYFVISVWSYLSVCFLIFPLFILFYRINCIRRLDASLAP